MNWARSNAPVANSSSQHESPGRNRRPSVTAATAPPDRRPIATAASGSPGGPSAAAAVTSPNSCPRSQRTWSISWTAMSIAIPPLCSRNPGAWAFPGRARADRVPAAVLADPGRRRLLVPLVAGDQRRRAERSRRKPLAQAPQLGHEAPPVADLQQDAGVVGGPRGGRGVLRGQPARLLAQDRHAGRGKPAHQVEVQRRGRGDQRGVATAGGEEAVDVGKGGNALARDLVARVRGGVDDGGCDEAGAGGQRLEVRAPHAPGADDGDAQALAHAAGWRTERRNS